MVPETETYNKILELLRKSRPILSSTKEVGNAVLRKISNTSRPERYLSDVTDFIFGWVYITWVRRSLIFLSTMLIVVFIWQQSMILSRINGLSRQTIVIGGETVPTRINDIEKLLTMYRNPDGKYFSKAITISEKEIEEIIESAKEMQVKYKELENLINSDPVLKKYVEKKLEENKRSKIKL